MWRVCWIRVSSTSVFSFSGCNDSWFCFSFKSLFLKLSFFFLVCFLQQFLSIYYRYVCFLFAFFIDRHIPVCHYFRYLLLNSGFLIIKLVGVSVSRVSSTEYATSTAFIILFWHFHFSLNCDITFRSTLTQINSIYLYSIYETDISFYDYQKF